MSIRPSSSDQLVEQRLTLTHVHNFLRLPEHGLQRETSDDSVNEALNAELPPQFRESFEAAHTRSDTSMLQTTPEWCHALILASTSVGLPPVAPLSRQMIRANQTLCLPMFSALRHGEARSFQEYAQTRIASFEGLDEPVQQVILDRFNDAWQGVTVSSLLRPKELRAIKEYQGHTPRLRPPTPADFANMGLAVALTIAELRAFARHCQQQTRGSNFDFELSRELELRPAPGFEFCPVALGPLGRRAAELLPELIEIAERGVILSDLQALTGITLEPDQIKELVRGQWRERLFLSHPKIVFLTEAKAAFDESSEPFSPGERSLLVNGWLRQRNFRELMRHRLTDQADQNPEPTDTTTESQQVESALTTTQIRDGLLEASGITSPKPEELRAARILSKCHQQQLCSYEALIGELKQGKPLVQLQKEYEALLRRKPEIDCASVVKHPQGELRLSPISPDDEGYTISYFRNPKNGEVPFLEWLNDPKVPEHMRKRIRNRLEQVEQGNLGDYHHIDSTVAEISVWELRFFARGGYRVYFCFGQDNQVILLGGGNKSSTYAQDAQIAAAVKLAATATRKGASTLGT